MSDYPKMLFRIGTELAYQGKMLDTLVVGAADEHDIALEAGFTDLAAALSDEPVVALAPANEMDILDYTAPQIVTILPNVSDDDLLELLEAEEAGKTRKSVIAAIKAEMATR